jgi:hypothetical protein
VIIGEWIRRRGYLLRRGAMEEERHNPGFALAARITLALGIGVNIGMFTVVNSVLLRPLYEQPDEVVEVYGRSSNAPGDYRFVSYPNYLDLREGTTDVFASLAAVSTGFVGLDVGDGARRTLACRVTVGYFQIFDRPLALGRPFTMEEERSRVAILSFALWQQRGGDARIIGQTIQINGDIFTVIGVAAKGFTGTGLPGPDVWVPLTGPMMSARDAHAFSVVGRLRSSVSGPTRAHLDN